MLTIVYVGIYICLSPGLSACLSLRLPDRDMTEKHVKRFSRNFTNVRTWHNNKYATFSGCYFRYWSFFFIFSCANPCLLSMLRKMDERIIKKLHSSDLRTFGVLHITPWFQDRLSRFLHPCLLATLRKNGWMDFHAMFRICRTRHDEIKG